MSDNCDDPNLLAMKILKNLGGAEAVKDMVVGCHAAGEGRYGYAELQAMKVIYRDIPVHQFSSSEAAKPAETPSAKNADNRTKGQSQKLP